MKVGKGEGFKILPGRGSSCAQGQRYLKVTIQPQLPRRIVGEWEVGDSRLVGESIPLENGQGSNSGSAVRGMIFRGRGPEIRDRSGSEAQSGDRGNDGCRYRKTTLWRGSFGGPGEGPGVDPKPLVDEGE